MSKLKSTLLASAFGGALFVAGMAPALAAETKADAAEPAVAAQNPQEAVVAVEALSDVEMDRLSKAGLQAMQLIGLAVSDIANDQGDAAGQKLTHAAEILAYVEKAEPNVRATDGIGHLVGGDGPFYLPLTAKSDIVFDDAPGVEAQKEIEKAAQLMAQGKIEDAAAVLKAANAKIAVSWMTLPVDATLERVEAAIAGIQSDDKKAALESLVAIRDSIHVTTETMELPS